MLPRDGLDGGRRHGLAEQLADELAQGLVGRAVAGVIDVMLQVVEQLIAARDNAWPGRGPARAAGSR